MKELSSTFLDDLFGFLNDNDFFLNIPDLDSCDEDEDIDPDFDDLPFCDTDDDIRECDALDCDSCEFRKECEEDSWHPDEDLILCGIPAVRRIVFSDPATIVFWMDDTKTVVKCMKGEKFERYAGFAAACMKKMFGSTSAAKSFMERFGVDQAKNEKKPSGTEARNKNHNDAIQEAINEALER